MPVSSTYYTPCSPIIVGCRLYSDPAMTTPVPNGYYADGGSVYQVTGGIGVVTNITACFTTTATPCVGDCCFIGSTMILLPEGASKRIDEIQQNDVIITYNETTDIIEENKVISIRSRQSNDLVKYTFSNGVVNISTADHPYYVNGLNIASFSPSLTEARYGFEIEVLFINIGDTVNLADGSTVYIENIEILTSEEVVYTLEVENNHNYYANGILVHNKTLGPICCYNVVTGENISITNAGGATHPGCCCLGPNWVAAPPEDCNLNPGP